MASCHAPRVEGLAPPEAVQRLHFNIARRPFLVLFELTHACELACRHCRAEAAPEAEPDELTTTEGRGVLDDLASLEAPRPIGLVLHRRSEPRRPRRVARSRRLPGLDARRVPGRTGGWSYAFRSTPR